MPTAYNVSVLKQGQGEGCWGEGVWVGWCVSNGVVVRMSEHPGCVGETVLGMLGL